MGYIFLLFAILSGVTKGYCGKKTSGYTTTFQSSVFANTIRMVLCTLIGFALIVISGDLALILPSFEMLLISAFSGITTAIFVVTWLISVKKSAYMMLDIFLMLGTLIPMLLSSAFFFERIKPIQWVGVAVLFLAVTVMCSYSNSIKGKITPYSLLLLIVCGVFYGLSDFSQKIFVKTITASSVSIFNFYTYIFASVVLIITLALVNKNNNTLKQNNFKKIFGYVLVMAICLFLNSYLKIFAAKQLDAVILYPLNQGGSMILSSIMTAVIFKEKLTLKAIIGIITAFLGLLIINFL